MTRTILFIFALIAPVSAFASTPWDKGCAAPAPEIGVGVLGAVLSVAAVKWFKRR